MIKALISNNWLAFVTVVFVSISLVQHWNKFDLDIQGKHAWRQSATMWNVRNYVRHDPNILNPRLSHFNGGKDNIVRLEFPLMQWLMSKTMLLFGEHIIITRFFMFGISILSTLGMYKLFKSLFGDNKVSLIASLIFSNSPLFFYYAVNPLPDLLALCFAVWYLVTITQYEKEKRRMFLWLSCALLCLSAICKIPFILFSSVSLLLFKGQREYLKLFEICSIHLLFLMPVVLWYSWVIPSWEPSPALGGVLKYGIDLQTLGEYLWYHLSTMFPFIIMSPISLILLVYGLIKIKGVQNIEWVLWLAMASMMYLILEINAIGKIHDYYMLPFLPWIFVIIAHGIKRIYDSHPQLIYLCLVTQLIYTPIVTERWWSVSDQLINPEIYLYKEELKDVVPSDALCIILNDPSNVMFSYQIDKMGFVFDNDYLPIEWIDDMRNNYNVRYMYSDSDVINKNEEVLSRICKELHVAGRIKVFQFCK